MRTTLKRGIGRGAAVNGNGRSVLPPGALTPVTVYEQPDPHKHRKLHLLGRVVLWLLTGLAVLVAAFVGGVYLWLHESVAAVRPHSKDVKSAQSRLDDVPPPGQAANALVVGYDRRADEGTETPSRSDTVMLVRADPATKTISLLSFPRDLVVEVRCPGRPSFLGRINSAYTTCGSRGTLETVRALTGLPVNYLITVNFRAFKQVVNKLGGVWIDVDRRYFNDNRGLGPGFNYATINLQPGYQLLTGGSALDYVRYRHTDSDLYRLARQQQFVRAMKNQLARFSVKRVPGIVSAVTHNVEVGVGGGRELSPKTVLSYAFFAYGLPPGHFFQAKIEGLSGYSELTTARANIDAAVREFVNPDVEAAKVATAVALGRKLRTQAPKPSETSVTTLNGNGVAGSAADAAYVIGQRGYRIVSPPNNAPANAPRFDYFHTKIYYSKARGAKLAARQLAKLITPADVAPIPREIRPLSQAMLTVVVGQTFDGDLGQPAVKEAPKRQPAAVIYNPQGRDLLRAAQKKVDFPLMVPHVLERTSVVDPEKPLRVYKMEGGKRGVRLTFRTGAREYWGIQMTDWDDAPILGEKNFRYALKGRTYDFYYSGPRLHMVVLREKGATYWVVNTLLNSLSNETMIAIAKGLRPLGAGK